jgi:Flp pilus assembly protein TadG
MHGLRAVDAERVALNTQVELRRVRLHGEHGSSTMLAAALLTPVFIVLLFAAVQAALWGHARTTARVAARDAAAQVARFEVDPSDAEASARASLSASDIDNVDVQISGGDDIVLVTITGDAPGIIIGTSRSVSVTEAVPVERLTP